MRTRIVILLVVVVVGGFLLGRASAKAGGRPQAQSERGCTVPKAWGSFKGSLTFEDAAGTIRSLNADACQGGQTEVSLTIRRQ